MTNDKKNARMNNKMCGKGRTERIEKIERLDIGLKEGRNCDQMTDGR
jgi:hypothetical protein